MRKISGLAALLCAGAWATLAHADEPAAVDTGGWKAVAGGHGTGCATDATPYEFYVHEGDPRRVAIYFQGGGGCWNSRNCGLDGQKTFDNAVDDGDRPWLNKAGAGGILDAANPANPLREFTIVFAPYCTADVHLGVRTERFETSDGKHLERRLSRPRECAAGHGLGDAAVHRPAADFRVRRQRRRDSLADLRVAARASLHKAQVVPVGRRRRRLSHQSPGAAARAVGRDARAEARSAVSAISTSRPRTSRTSTRARQPCPICSWGRSTASRIGCSCFSWRSWATR